MKLKFEKEIQSIINTIFHCSEVSAKSSNTWSPHSYIVEFDQKLIKQKDDQTLPVKQWLKLRRQISFLHEMVLIADMAAKKFCESKAINIDSQDYKKEKYHILTGIIKDIHTGHALQQPQFVRIALRYGVIHLSDHEIQKLIENNKI